VSREICPLIRCIIDGTHRGGSSQALSLVEESFPRKPREPIPARQPSSATRSVVSSTPEAAGSRTETPKSVAEESEPFSGEIPEENEFKAHVTVTKKTFWLKHAIAFEGNWFDDKVPFVISPEKPVSERDLQAAVEKGFDAQGLFFMEMGRHLCVQCGDTTSISGWAENLSFGSTDDLVADVKVENDRIKGTLTFSRLQQLGPFEYSYNVEFNLPKKW
jgi:hypothetical protein